MQDGWQGFPGGPGNNFVLKKACQAQWDIRNFSKLGRADGKEYSEEFEAGGEIWCALNFIF